MGMLMGLAIGAAIGAAKGNLLFYMTVGISFGSVFDNTVTGGDDTP